MGDSVRVLVVGLGNMGLSHAGAYQKLDGFEIVGLCSRTIESRTDLPPALAALPRFADYGEALRATAPDAVSINTWPDTHAEFALAAFDAGAHVFLEKPIAETVRDARRVVDAARECGRKLVVGYILRHHPSWTRFVKIARTLGSPLVMRMNLNQQSSGVKWETHKHLMRSLSPIVDCGVHYVDMMCLVTGAKPVSVHAIGARLSDEIDVEMYNYGQLQVTFDDGSVGWYESGWGPMMSEEAFFIKDIIGPKGCVSMVKGSASRGGAGGERGASDDIDSHTATDCLRVHHAALGPDGAPAKADELISMDDEPGHVELCEREQAYFLKAIREDIDLADHMNEAVRSLEIVLAADRSVREGGVVKI